MRTDQEKQRQSVLEHIQALGMVVGGTYQVREDDGGIYLVRVISLGPVDTVRGAVPQ